MTFQTLTNREYRKRATRRHILTLIHSAGSISQTQIVEKTKIRLGTIQLLIEELIRENLIRIKGEGESRGGRRPTLLEINPDSHWTIGLDIDEERIIGGLVNLKGEIVNQKSKVGFYYKDQNELIESIATIIKELINDFYGKKSIIGIGIGIPGLVDREKGIGIYCPYYDWWRNVPVKSLLENMFDFPFYIEHDCMAETLGEKWFGVGKGVENFLYIDIDETVGMGIVINGELYYGNGGNAGEIGHTVIQKDGPLCICGNKGCLTTMASCMALRREAQNLLQKGVKSLIFDSMTNSNKGKEITLETIVNAVMKGDKVAYKLIYDTGAYLGIAISNIVNIFNPELIILGGPLMEAKDILMEIITQSIKIHCLPNTASEVRIVPSELGDKSGILGASTLVTRQFFEFR